MKSLGRALCASVVVAFVLVIGSFLLKAYREKKVIDVNTVNEDIVIEKCIKKDENMKLSKNIIKEGENVYSVIFKMRGHEYKATDYNSYVLSSHLDKNVEINADILITEYSSGHNNYKIIKVY